MRGNHQQLFNPNNSKCKNLSIYTNKWKWECPNWIIYANWCLIRTKYLKSFIMELETRGKNASQNYLCRKGCVEIIEWEIAFVETISSSNHNILKNLLNYYYHRYRLFKFILWSNKIQWKVQILLIKQSNHTWPLHQNYFHFNLLNSYLFVQFLLCNLIPKFSIQFIFTFC